LVAAVSQWRRHDELGALELRTFGIGFVEQQVLDEGFDPHFDTAILASRRFAERLVAAQVDDVNRSVEYGGKGQQVMHALGFDQRRAALMMPLGPGFSLSEQPLLQFEDEVGVFAMSGGDDSELPGQAQGFVELLIGYAKSAFVGQENFET